MTLTAFYHFIPSKAEEERGEASGNLPLHPTRYEYVEVRDETPKLLNLFNQWDIKKVLTPIDIGTLGGLVLSQEQVFNHIFKYWDREWIWRVMDHGEHVITIRDLDTKSDYDLYLKKSTIEEGFFVISTFWTRDFVYRRELKEGDTIGLYWHQKSKTFCFSVLKRT